MIGHIFDISIQQLFRGSDSSIHKCGATRSCGLIGNRDRHDAIISNDSVVVGSCGKVQFTIRAIRELRAQRYVSTKHVLRNFCFGGFNLGIAGNYPNGEYRLGFREPTTTKKVFYIRISVRVATLLTTNL